MTAEIQSAYLAPEGLNEPLLKEIEGVISVQDPVSYTHLRAHET